MVVRKVSRKVSSITAIATNVYRCIEENPDREVNEILELLNMSRRTFYGYLIGFKNEVTICDNGKFKVLENGKRLSITDVKSHLKNDAETNKPNKPERILYLYNLLHRNIPYGGVTFEDILKQYLTLLEHSSANLPKLESIRRMIYRDMDELEMLGIIIERPSTGSPKYCLRDKYLPKLPFEQASSLYVSMLLFEDTILDQMSNSAKEEFEKAFFKNSPHESIKINERIHVVGDTLVNPSEFGDKFTKLVTAVINSYQLVITYIKLHGDLSNRLLNPLGLVYKRGVWYLVAQNPDVDEYRTFRVDQILEVSLSNVQFDYPESFSLDEHIGSSWGVYTNDRVEIVRLKFSSRVASRVRSLRYHRSQELIEELADGSVIIGLEVCGLIELKSWLLQWGNEVEVLEPISLRDEVVKSAKEIIALYEYSE